MLMMLSQILIYQAMRLLTNCDFAYTNIVIFLKVPRRSFLELGSLEMAQVGMVRIIAEQHSFLVGTMFSWCMSQHEFAFIPKRTFGCARILVLVDFNIKCTTIPLG